MEMRVTMSSNIDDLKKKFNTTFEDGFSEEVWKTTYKHHTDDSVNDSLFRVAKAIASVETTEELKAEWTEKFYEMLSNFKVVPGGRILSNAGTGWEGTTLINCFVNPRSVGNLDSLDGILTNLRNQAQTLKSEGGWGENFSYIRPRGSFIAGIGVETPGAVKYMELFDKSSEIITSGSGKKSSNSKSKQKIRKGAMMGVLDVWHPDIYEFITAKQQPGRLTKFNISVNCTDEFMNKLKLVKHLRENNAPREEIETADTWNLEFPDTTHSRYDAEWDGNLHEWKAKGYSVIVYEQTTVSTLWDKIMESTYNRAEPGVLFLDRANFFNPLSYAEHISSTNPCLTANSLIVTDKGLMRFDQLVQRFQNGETVSCLSQDTSNGTLAYREVSAAFSSGLKQTVVVKFSNGMELTCTPDHRLLTSDGEWVEAQHTLGLDFVNHSNFNLNGNFDFNFTVANTWVGKNNRLYRTNLPTQWNDDLAVVLGWLIGDGWLTSNGFGLIFGKHDGEALPLIKSILQKWELTVTESVDKNQSTTLYVASTLARDFMVNLGVKRAKAHEKCIPESVFTAPEPIIQNFLKALFAADGTVPMYAPEGSNYSVSLSSASKQLLLDVQQLLQALNINHTTIYTINKQSSFVYTTIGGEEKTYNSQPVYFDLRIFGKSIPKFADKVGFLIERKQVALNTLVDKKFKNKSNIITVVDVSPGEVEEVFDLTEPVNHNFVVNGIVAHNCGEQVLAPGNICCLSSLNLTQFFDEQTREFDFKSMKKYASYAVRFLDNVNTYSKAPLKEYVDSMDRKRRIGVGLMGWGSLLYMMKIPFASQEAFDFKEKMLREFSLTTYETSIDLAIEKGMFEMCDPVKHAEQPFVKKLGLSDDYLTKLRSTGIRNSALMSNQPTGNSSIFANVVSGGIEPVFMPEYIRTVIVNAMPDEIKDVCPKWYEGEWYETDLFKFTKEGDEDILKGSFNGVTYKIDRNRGLTKEVVCQDYGVRWLDQRGEWDGNASWAKTTMNLSAQDHVNDLKGFAEFADSAVSKTCNIPHDYPYESFKDLYLQAYNTGYIKGFTTYRAGTMTAVLSAKEEKTAGDDQEEIVQDDVKIPSKSPATMNIIKAEGKKYYLTTIMDDENKRPIALFVNTNHHEKTATTHDAVERLLALAREKGIPEKWIVETEQKISNDTNINKLARTISLLLRHGVFIKHIVRVLDQVEDVFVGSFLFQIKKYLSQYIRDGELVDGQTCSNCGSSNIVFSEGCQRCADCSSSRCS